MDGEVFAFHCFVGNGLNLLWYVNFELSVVDLI
jgi:hypothetical protein